MFIHNKVSQSEANGPGNRTVVWFQGCALKCKGCWNPETHAFGKGQEVLITDLAKWILDQGADGITFSGGEPFQSAPALLVLIDMLKDARPDFSIGSFTGYTLKELREGKYKWWSTAYDRWIDGDVKMADAILKQMDFIIAGRYNPQLRCDDKPLCGSSNQEVHFLSTRYSAKNLHSNIVEMLVDKEEGLVQITGFPETLEPVDHPDDPADDNLVPA